MSSGETQSPRKAVIWTGRIISALPVLLMAFSASMKLSMSDQVVKSFEHYGYAKNVIFALGITELSCAIIYCIPQTAVLGAILVTGYLGGAVATHVRAGEPQFILPAIFGVVAWLGLFMREPRLRALIPLRRL